MTSTLKTFVVFTTLDIYKTTILLSKIKLFGWQSDIKTKLLNKFSWKYSLVSLIFVLLAK